MLGQFAVVFVRAIAGGLDARGGVGCRTTDGAVVTPFVKRFRGVDMKIHAWMLMLSMLVGGCASSPPQKAMVVPALATVAAPAPGVVTSGRFGAAEVLAIHDSGIRHVIDLTQESESPDFDEEAVLAASGIGYERLAIGVADGLTRENVQAFDRLLSEAEKPVLVHCGVSNRVGAMAALRAGWIEGKSVEEAIAVGRAWGLTSLEPVVRKKLGARGFE